MFSCALASPTARHATRILAAWRRRDLSILDAELEEVLRTGPETADSPAEEERAELLQEIAREIRRIHTRGERFEICVSLLEHLVACESVG